MVGNKMNKEQRKFKQKSKVRQRRKDFVKKNNILKQWQKEQDNRRREGLSMKQMPTDFPKSRK